MQHIWWKGGISGGGEAFDNGGAAYQVDKKHLSWRLSIYGGGEPSLVEVKLLWWWLSVYNGGKPSLVEGKHV